ncbi:MAG: sensor histidine kinase, partial [Armatimonadota bacterium]
RDSAIEYRKARAAVAEVVESLAVVFGDRYNDELMRDYYNEVSIMLHRIKNKLTAVPTSLQTILPQTYDGVFIDGDTLSPENAQYLQQYEELRTRCLRETLAFLDRLEAAVASESDDGIGDVRDDLGRLRRTYDELRSFVRANQEQIQAIKRKLSPDAIARVDEFLNDALEGGILTTELTMELQEIQNELYNREPPVWEPIPIKEALEEAFKESAVDARGKNIEYTLRMDAGDPVVFGIERQLKRPLAQVINNAIKYTPEGGKVEVSLAESDGYVLIKVKDTGIGIPPGEEDLVFGYLTRCTNAQEFNKQGTGTGLYQDRKTIRLHNGDMWAESEGINQGTTFFIKLPIYQKQTASSDGDKARRVAGAEAPRLSEIGSESSGGL